MRILFAVVFAFGCGGSKSASTTPKEPPTCSVVADAMVAMVQQGRKNVEEEAGDIATIIRTRCTDDQWTPEARKCLADMKTNDDAKVCATLLTDDQQANLARDQDKRMKIPDPEGEPIDVRSNVGAGPPKEAPPPPPAPATKAVVEDKKNRPEKPKRSKGSPKPGDPCDGGE